MVVAGQGWLAWYLALLICAAVLVVVLSTGFLKEMASKRFAVSRDSKGAFDHCRRQGNRVAYIVGTCDGC
jgi:hypothetical protein